MRKEILVCDYCGKENLETFIEIKDGLVQRGSGKEAGTLIGYYIDEIKEKLFCSVTCLDSYISLEIGIKYGSRRDRWELGEEPKKEEK